MKFYVVHIGESMPVGVEDTIVLFADGWNDYSFKTMFRAWYYDSEGTGHDIEDLRIAFRGQRVSTSTDSIIPKEFETLPDEFFSLGTSVYFYQNLKEIIGSRVGMALEGLNDLAHNPTILGLVKDEDVFKTSLLRGTGISSIKGQFHRVIHDLPMLTDYQFGFLCDDGRHEAFSLTFNVESGSTPRTNVQAVIGRNGVGKTSLLTQMVQCITAEGKSRFLKVSPSSSEDDENRQDLDKDYFSKVVSVSFSAFDAFEYPSEQSDPIQGTCYKHIGLKKPLNSGGFEMSKVYEDCQESLNMCIKNSHKKKALLRAIETLSRDPIFCSINISELLERLYLVGIEEYQSTAQRLINEMSSGHSIIFTSIIQLVDVVEEKTLVLMDEPEGHLHPPLLASFLKAVSDLLYDLNGVCIMATHSPVVLQEVPKSCVWKMNRSGRVIRADRPTIETYGENIGVLTQEVFGLEVQHSSFVSELQSLVSSGMEYNQCVEALDGQLGQEGRAILKSLILGRRND